MLPLGVREQELEKERFVPQLSSVLRAYAEREVIRQQVGRAKWERRGAEKWRG